MLQREPHIAAIYGMSPSPNVEVKLTLINEANGATETSTTNTFQNGNWKFLLKKPYPNGGNFSILVECPACNNTKQTIYNVTFGDVYICTGQSNMWLPMGHTFNRNYTYNNISKFGKYSNIRFITPVTNDIIPYCVSDLNASYTRPIEKNAQYHWQQSYQIKLLNDFSAACWYFAETLSDIYNLSNITFGLINTALGGSVIESWAVNNTIYNFNTNKTVYCNDINPSVTPAHGFGCLYNGLVIPFINYTIKAQLWYQGENDVGHYPSGNILNSTGYACIEQLMIKQWRANWSIIENTTDKLFPFGVVALAAGTSEGHDGATGGFRWSQSLNFDIMPNNGSQNTFLVQGYDIGDPWAGNCPNYLICNTTTAPWSLLTTHWVEGPIHCRPKIYVGQRYARGASKFIYGNDHIYTGPLISSCELNSNKITIQFNKTLLYGEKVIVQQWSPWYNTSIPKPLHWSAFQVLVNKTKWMYINDEGMSEGSDGMSVIVDVSEFNGGTIDGIRYAWLDHPCCGELNTAIYPCPMNSCPIVTSDSLLPAQPIWAKIENNKCVCYPPQVC